MDFGKKPSGTWHICINEIPYQVQKSRIIEKIADLILNKKLIMVSDVRDESSEEIRIIIEPKSRNVSPEDIMNTLYQVTDLEIRVQLNLNVLDSDGSPKIMPLNEAIISWIDHRREILIRISNNSLNKTINRLEILDSFLIVFLNLDEVISIIREEEDPKKKLMMKFKLSENQVVAILDMKLRNLRKLEEQQIKQEKVELQDKKSKLEKLLKEKKLQWKNIKNEILNIKKIFKNELNRKTNIENKNIEYSNDISLKIEKEPVTVIVSKKGWVKSLKGHSADLDSIKFKEGDELGLYLFLSSLDDLLLFAENGRFYNIPVYKLPTGRGFGEPLSLVFDDIADEKILFLSNSKNENYY